MNGKLFFWRNNLEPKAEACRRWTSETHGIGCSADGLHSEGAWARTAKKCKATVHMLALHVADSLSLAAGPGESPALCLHASNPPE